MSYKKDKEAIVVVLDVGHNMKQPFNDNGDSFLTLSKECISHIVQRKIFSNSSDLIGLITFGCKETCNKLANEKGGNAFKNIALLTPHVTIAYWELLRAVCKVESNENHCVADWLDAIFVAVDFLADEKQSLRFTHLKIVMFSNFAHPVLRDHVANITEAIKHMGINLVIIGPDISKEEYLPGKQKSQEQRTNESLVEMMVNEVDGIICSFDDALPELMNFQRKTVKPTPWNALFTVTSRIKIPIRAFKKTAETVPPKWITSSVDDPSTFVTKERTYMKLNENELETKVDQDDIINAYRFGTSVVPFSDIDKQTMDYKSGEKGLYLIGVTKKENVSSHILMGNGSYILLARQDDSVAQTTFEAFTKAMFEMNHVGIARRIYSNDSSPILVVLFPVVSPDANYLVFTELPYAEDEHVFKFPSLSGVKLSDEQLKAVDSLIDKMDFDANEEQNEKYEPTKVYDHHEQYLFKVLSYRALNSNERVPEKLIASSRNLLKPSDEWIESYKNESTRIKRVFPLKRVEEYSDKKTTKRTHESVKDETAENSGDGNKLFVTVHGNNINDKTCESLKEKLITDISNTECENWEIKKGETCEEIKDYVDSECCAQNDTDIDKLMDAF